MHYVYTFCLGFFLYLLGQVISSVRATDSDTRDGFNTASIRYRIAGDFGAAAFFSVNPNNGDISARPGIANNNADSYQVCV